MPLPPVLPHALYYSKHKATRETLLTPTVANPGHATAIAAPWAGLNTVGCDEGSEPQRARETLGFVPQTSAALSAVIAHRRAERPRWRA